MEEIYFTSGINNCGGRCIIKAHVKDGKVFKLTTDSGDGKDGVPPLCSCTRGKQYIETFLGDNRLKYPMKRVGERGEGKFVRISWKEAVDTIITQWKRIKETYGVQSRYVNYATGITALMKGNLLAKRLLALDGGFLDSYNSYSTACISTATPYTYGTNLTGNTLEDWVNSKLIILWGHNPAETRFGTALWHLKQAKAAGVKIIVVDPRYSDTAKGFADQWIGLRPGTDSALMDGMAYTIYTENLQDQAFMDKYCIGFDSDHMPEGYDGSESYISYLLGQKDGIVKTPKWAEKITGVQEDIIKTLAREYATTKPAALVQGYGPQRHANGEQNVRSGTMLACLTGNVGISGGWACGQGSVERHKNPSFPVLENLYKGKIPCFLWADAIIRANEMTLKDDGVKGVDKLEGNIKMIFNLASNTLLNQHSDINRTIEILKDTSKCEFIVCSDLFMTPSAKFADILLPGTSMFEGENITMPWAYGDYLLYNQQVIEPLYECRFEYDWLSEVAEGLNLREQFTAGHENVRHWLKALYEDLREKETELPEFEIFAAEGGYKYKNNPTVIAFKQQIEDLEHHPFPTPSGKIEIFSERLFRMNQPEDIPAVPKYVSAFEGLDDSLREKYPLQMIGWHTKRRTHSTHDCNEKLEKIEKQQAWINLKDAQKRNIKDGDLVEIWNDRGKIHIPAFVTTRIIEGVIAVSQGAWYTPDSEGTDKRGSINVLTTSKPTPLAKGNPQHSNLVEIKLANTSNKSDIHII
jgi:anaerobic dimethyl sulfoxide reductase subunit A